MIFVFGDKCTHAFDIPKLLAENFHDGPLVALRLLLTTGTV
jgi:hypothetical protein